MASISKELPKFVDKNSKYVKTKSFRLAVLVRGNENAKKLAILSPGRLDTKDYANFVSHANYLATRGFLAVAFDPPGTWGSPGNINLFTTTNYIKAINELIEYFGNKPTLLIGHSRGATAAILVSISNPHVIGIIPIMPNYGAPTAPSGQDVKQGFKIEHRDLPPGTSKTTSVQKKFALPIAFWEDGKQYAVLQALKSCTKPKLLICGTKDTFTSPEEVKNVYKTIPAPKMIAEIKSEHDYRYYPKAIEQINETIEKFLQKFKI